MPKLDEVREKNLLRHFTIEEIDAYDLTSIPVLIYTRETKAIVWRVHRLRCKRGAFMAEKMREGMSFEDARLLASKKFTPRQLFWGWNPWHVRN